MSRQSQDLYTSVHTAHNKIDKLDKRLTALETRAIPFDGCLECPAPLLLDLVKRVCALDDGSDYEVHPHTCGDCQKPYRRENSNLACFDAPGCAVTNWEKPIWRAPDTEACPDFEATP